MSWWNASRTMSPSDLLSWAEIRVDCSFRYFGELLSDPYGVIISTFIRDSVPDVVQQALHALACIAQSLSGAQAAIDAKILVLTNDLLDSPNAQLRMLTCQMLGHLSCHESPANAVLSVNPCLRLVSLLRQVLILFVGT